MASFALSGLCSSLVSLIPPSFSFPLSPNCDYHKLELIIEKKKRKYCCALCGKNVNGTSIQLIYDDDEHNENYEGEEKKRDIC